ncbi:hypothetical protein BPNPMPFG_000311 [Mesorhizobium sp. AR07]|uniref:hypothetical protein n=1 Tax=Mesorhizobium sp. AR07 TaxID=2865838 RepID=UPI0021601AA3|nr:hypothetical protein [Mesorhizobium sp. AR07]UVK44846.1 hypothetical protein BPNPMPFG_000311 [Mesorhizobium sp. AR07]
MACGDYLGELGDPLALVVSLNLKRRHLNESQRAMVAAKLATMKHGGDRRSDQAENLPLVTQKQAAELLNTSDRNIRTAATVQRDASQELIAAVEGGKVAVSAAAKATKFMDKDEQRKAVSDGTIAKAVAEHRRAETKLKEAEKVIAEAPKFTNDEAERIKECVNRCHRRWSIQLTNWPPI